jgi:hypothetical protein
VQIWIEWCGRCLEYGVFASFNSLPRNPVFRCWNVVSTEYETDKLDTDDSNSDHSYDEENPDVMKSRGRHHDDTDNEDDYYQRSSAESISLFGGSRTKSVPSRREGAVRSGTGPDRSGSDRTSRSEYSSSMKKPIAAIDEEEILLSEVPRLEQVLSETPKVYLGPSRDAAAWTS